MSFSSQIRETLCRTQTGCGKCVYAELAGIISFSGQFNTDRLKLLTEKPYTANRIIDDIFKCTGLSLQPVGKRTIKIETENMQIIQILRKKLNLSAEDFKERMLKRECCRRAFIRGCFIGGGCVADPNRNYHLEFDTKYRLNSERLTCVLERYGVAAKITYRKGHYPVYIKGSQDIADVLGLMGADMGALELYSVQMKKELTNNINRQVNCETANQKRVSIAALHQMTAIRKIRAGGDLDKLPEVLQEIAYLREQYPEESLKELGEMLDPPIGKSGVNHRLNRLIKYADEL